MAIEVFPDSPTTGMSPRISFSHDLSQSDVVPVEEYISTTTSSAIDFDFCVFRESFDQSSSSADELFFDGKILPIQIKKRLPPPTPVTNPPPQPPSPPLPPPSSPLPPPPPPQKPAGKSRKAEPSTETKNPVTPEPPEEKQKSFWRFKRSSSLNCGGSGGYGGTLCPLPLLSRSNSTGSASSSKRSSVSNNQKQSFLKYAPPNSSGQKHAPPPPPQSSYSSSKPPLKKNGHASNHINGFKFNHVLNVPPANLFGFGSIFAGGSRDRSKKKF